MPVGEGVETSEEEAAGQGETEGRDDVDVVRRCVLYANQTSFGEECPAPPVSGPGVTWREILGEQPFPSCQASELPVGMVAPLPPRGQTGVWRLHVCHDNVTLDGVVAGESLVRRAELVFYPAGSLVPELTPEQRRVYTSLMSDYPTPVVVFGPVHPPRVGVPTTFWLAAPPGTGERVELVTADGRTLSTLVVVAQGENGSILRAYVDRTLIYPGVSPDERPVVCAGAGLPRPEGHRPVAGQPCTFTYERSSAHLPDNRYNLTVESVWAVEYRNPDGSFTALDAQVPVTTLFRSPVHEIQTIATTTD